MKLRVILYIVLLLCPSILAAQNIESCDSLLRAAIQASDEKDYFSSLDLLSQAEEIARQKNAYEYQFWIYTNIGINYAELTDYPTSLNNLSKAYQIAVEKLDKRFEMSVINNIAGVYILDRKYEEALEQSMLAYKSALDSGDSLFIGGCAMNIANISLSLNKYEQTAEYIEIAEKMFVNSPKESLDLQIIKANYLCKNGKYEEAYQKALQVLNKAMATSQEAVEAAALIVLVQTMVDVKDYNAAIKYSRQALSHAISIEERKKLYETLADIYYTTQRYRLAYLYQDSVLQVSDSIRNIQAERNFENANTQIELLRRENEIEEYRLRAQAIYIVLGMGILASIILAWALINQIVKNRQEKEISHLNIEREKHQQQLLQKQLEEQRTQALLEEERYKHEIELRDKELMTKAMIVANRNDIVTNIVGELSKSQYLRDSNDTFLKHTITRLQQAIDENEAWQDFSTYFEQRNDAFIAALREKHPELNANEIRFLSLIYINLSTKEIASLLNITPEYCKKKRQQLARKMGFENSKALFSYLSTLA